MKSNTLKIGQKFNYQFTTPFGKIVKEVITIVAINNNFILMDNGKEFHISQIQ